MLGSIQSGKLNKLGGTQAMGIHAGTGGDTGCGMIHTGERHPGEIQAGRDRPRGYKLGDTGRVGLC